MKSFYIPEILGLDLKFYSVLAVCATKLQKKDRGRSWYLLMLISLYIGCFFCFRSK